MKNYIVLKGKIQDLIVSESISLLEDSIKEVTRQITSRKDVPEENDPQALSGEETPERTNGQ